MAAAFNPVVGSLVWVEDPEVVWTDGEVMEVNIEKIKVLCTSGKMVSVKASNVHSKEAEASPCGVDDMTELVYLHEPGVLQNLRSRYDMDKIYTYTGNILIAVNPFKKLPNLYGKHIMELYKGANFGERSPHPFAIADAAYRRMINGGISQSVLVSGESGAGKTVTAKQIMHYLAYIGGRAVEQRVVESNTILEAFGNAKTVGNNNSSRFVKFVQIQFDQRGRTLGAAIKTYLLETSRICHVSQNERNYHCFYMLCAAPPEGVTRFKLGHPSSFHYLNQSECYELDGVDDSEEYLATRRAMATVGISSEEQDAIFRVVAAILHLGNIEFANGEEIDSSQVKDKKSRFHLRIAAELLRCDAKALEDSLCKHVILTPNEPITKWLDPHSAVVSRDTLAKIVYSRLFDWLVCKINSSIGQDYDSKFLIGVLDIYGFESFKTNSFEQFCINLTNEKLQQHFNQHVFKMEQEKYTKEEIDWSNIDFVDNQDVLDLIENKPGGIIALLDEACMFPRSTHETFSYKLRQKFKNHKRFRKPKLPHTDFTICHYAGDVTYQTELFLYKNKDYFFAEHHALLNASECSLVSGLFPALSDQSSKTSKFSSIGSRFKQQLHDLLETLCAVEPHYIRCIKPNYLLKPGIFESKYVLHQLQCGGVMEAIRISCSGYPTRKQFYEFVAWFGILAPEVLSGSFDEVAACKKVLEKVGLKGYQIGKTKVFLRAGLMAELDACRSEVLGRLVSIIQRRIRSYLAHRNFILLRLSAIHIQAACKGQLDRKVYESMRREASCLRIQRELQMYVARKAYKELCSSAVSIQTAVRGMIACSEHRFRRQRRAAIIIQAEMEEAKTQENEKLQFAFQETQLQFKESKETLMKEHDVAKQAAEQILIVDDVPVIDCAMLEKLMSENEELKVLVSSLEQKIDETEKKYEETNKISEERLKQALEAESKIIQLKTAMQRPEIFFDLESENPILWKQALLNSPLKRISEHASALASQENVDALIRCVMENIGFSNGKPVAAFTIYKCLLHWKSFEAERTSVFEHLIRMIGSAIENQDSNDNLAYWLSNTSVLLFFLQQSLKAVGVTNATRHKKPSPPTSLFGRISMGFLSFPSSSLAAARLDVVRQVEAKYPALLFQLQFTAYVEKIYGTIRDNLKKELASLLFLHIQAPRTSKGRLVRSGHSFGKCSPSTHWQSIIGCLNALLSTLKENFVPPFLVQKIFTQVFSFINVQLFNSLLLRRECCTFSNGEYVKAGLADLELWCCQAKEEYADSSWDELKHIRQAVGFLVIRQKYKISYAEITNDLCPILSIQQLYRICSLYRDDINNTQSLPPDVISSMRALIIEDSNNAVNSWFLLDDTSSIPFAVDDLSNSLQEKDFVDVKPAEELLNNPAFQFLH